MNLSNLLGRINAGVSKAPETALGADGATRIGDVVMAMGVANDVADPANDSFRPHIVARRVERRERRDIRSA
jgi:hypothetical protein